MKTFIQASDHIAQYEERTAKLKADIPTLEGIMSKKWAKEDELKQLKSDLATLDRKIQAEIAPQQEETDGVENIQSSLRQSEDAIQLQSATDDVCNHSIIADSTYAYNNLRSSRSFHY